MKQYSRQGGDSKYPIVSGHVIELTVKRARKNKKLSQTWDHTVFIWIMSVKKLTKTTQPKTRKVRVTMYYLPREPFTHEHYFMEVKKVQFEYLTKLMRSGFEVVAEGITYDGHKESIGRFYRVVGAL